MSTLQLFNIYHSFLLKKWYLLLYIFLLFIGATVGAAALSHYSEKETTIKLGVIDRDQTKETKLILSAVGNGQMISKGFSIEHYTETEASKLLKSHRISGYIAFDKGMTKAFYNNGELPISVHTYDETSVQSIAIHQLSNSVYSRLMLSEGGIKAYINLNKKASDEEIIRMMTELLFIGLDRNAAFDVTEVKTVETVDYIAVSIYFLTIFFVFIACSTVLKMNQEKALQARLNMYHFATEKLLLVRNIVALSYTTIYAILGYFIILKLVDTEIQPYNLLYVGTTIATFLMSIFAIQMIIELLFKGLMRTVILCIFVLKVLFLSGAIIPTIYFNHLADGFVSELLFAQQFNRLVDLLLSNYIVDWTANFYSQIIALCILLLVLVVWRYRR